MLELGMDLGTFAVVFACFLSCEKDELDGGWRWWFGLASIGWAALVVWDVWQLISRS